MRMISRKLKENKCILLLIFFLNSTLMMQSNKQNQALQQLLLPVKTSKVSSLTQQCLKNLRKGSSSHKTHLLGFMSEYIQDEEEIKIHQVDELCCYDRMKKILIKNDDTKEKRKQQEQTLFKAMQIEAKMNRLEKQLQKKKNHQRTHTPKAQNLFPDGKEDPKCKSHYFSFKNTMLEDLKQKGYQKFFQFQKIKKESNIIKIKSIIGEQVENKLKKVIDQKDFEKLKLIDQKKLLQRKILQKNVQIEILCSQNIHLKDYVKQIEQKLLGNNCAIQNTQLIAFYEKWLSEYRNYFGEMSIKDLNSYIDSIKTKCLEKFDIVQNKNNERLAEITQLNEEKCSKMKKNVENLERRQNELIEINKNLKLNKQISQMEINQLQRAKSQLLTLRQLIVSIYSQWYQKRTQNEKKLLKNFNKLKQNYSYQEMLNYIIFYQTKLSTDDKLNGYILKILRGIQKIRRTIFPLQGNEKLDPILVLDKIETWVSKKVKQFGTSEGSKMQKNHRVKNPVKSNEDEIFLEQ